MPNDDDDMPSTQVNVLLTLVLLSSCKMSHSQKERFQEENCGNYAGFRSGELI